MCTPCGSCSKPFAPFTPPVTLHVRLHVLLDAPAGRPHVYPGGSRIDPDTLSYLTEVRNSTNSSLDLTGLSRLEQQTRSQPASQPAQQPANRQPAN
jgi:hypothetical protein